MKPLTGLKSLLLAGGLFFIFLTGLYLAMPKGSANFNVRQTDNRAKPASCGTALTDAAYTKDIAEKLFPVLKSLNLM
jgi:hypothetical protein